MDLVRISVIEFDVYFTRQESRIINRELVDFVLGLRLGPVASSEPLLVGGQRALLRSGTSGASGEIIISI